ncbi:MAG: response regulator [Magnetococcales bacterium]|nr:response regulator [Magnetococcales bacterium]
MMLPQIKFSIGRRIFIGFGVVIAVFILQAVIINLDFNSVVKTFGIYGQTTTSATQILEIERNVLELQRSSLAFTYSGYNGVVLRVLRLQESLRKQLNTVSSTITDPKRRAILQRMTIQFEEYVETFGAAVEERQLREELVEKRMIVLGEQAVTILSNLIDKSVSKNDLFTAAQAGQAQEQLLLAHKDAFSFLRTPDSILVLETKKHLAHFNKILQNMKQTITDPKIHSVLDDLLGLEPKYHDAFLGMVRTTRTYFHLIYVVMAGQAAEFGHLARELKDQTLAQQTTVKNRLIEAISDSQNFSIMVSLFATLLGFLFAGRITKTIAEPIRAMTQTLKELASGHHSAEIPGRGRSDEIGSMAMAAHIFKEKAEELENASRYKSEFLANMSHELRTPLNSMLILSKLFADNRDGNLNENQQESARIIHESGSDLLRLINDILDLSKVEAGRMDVVVESRSFANFLQTMKRQFDPIAQNKGLTFNTEISNHIIADLETDWSKVEQIIRNLLSNAFKFTAQGSVTIRVHPTDPHTLFLSDTITPSQMIGISVSDTGIGIPQDKREQIFEAFRQVDGTTSRKYGGTGLGLSISRKFSQLLGGELQVGRSENTGTTFTLFLPIDISSHIENITLLESQKSGTNSERSASTSFTDLTRSLLVVDDDPRNAFAIQEILKERVKKLFIASDGIEALKILNDHPDIDLVLMDIMMPHMDGYQAMQKIREQPRFSHLPILALTAKAMPGDREKCIVAGATDYLSKPINTNLLLTVLSELLPTSEVKAVRLGEADQATITAPSSISTTTTTTPPSVSNSCEALQSATILVVDDDMRNTFSLAQILQDCTKRVLLAHDGLDALQKLNDNPDISIIIMDIMMPNMDGYQTMAKIRTQESHKNLPIIALTGNATLPNDRQKCLDAGADDYLEKPFEPTILLEKMSHCVTEKPTNPHSSNH